MRQIAPACGVVAVSKAGRDAGRSFVVDYSDLEEAEIPAVCARLTALLIG